MPNHFKVHELLSAAELEQLEAFAREPGRTVDECWDWLTERSFNVSRGAVGNWLAMFRAQLVTERMTAGGGLAKAMIEAAKTSGGLAIHEANLLQVGQGLFEACQKDDVDVKTLNQAALALQRLTLAKLRIEDVRAEFERRQRTAVEEASKVAREGGSAQSVVDKVDEILGVSRR